MVVRAKLGGVCHREKNAGGGIMGGVRGGGTPLLRTIMGKGGQGAKRKGCQGGEAYSGAFDLPGGIKGVNRISMPLLKGRQNREEHRKGGVCKEREGHRGPGRGAVKKKEITSFCPMTTSSQSRGRAGDRRAAGKKREKKMQK